MTILVTGFDRFGDLTFNPSELVAQQLVKSRRSTYGEALQGRILQTAYVAAANEIEALIRQTQPSIVLGFGVSESRDKICLERFALNLDDAPIQDNAACARGGIEIERGGPAAVKTNVDIAAILRRLVDGGVDAEISNHAGTFVCNHVYYRALRTLEKLRSQALCLFVHVPMPATDSTTVRTPSSQGWQMTDLQKAASGILDELARQRQQSDA